MIEHKQDIIYSTTILGIRHKGKVAMGGDGQVTLGNAVMKHSSRKIRKMHNDSIIAGFAGAYAMVDEHISPALPGVAIATAIVPPLANTGLCLSLGAYHGALGSFLLFS